MRISVQNQLFLACFMFFLVVLYILIGSVNLKSRFFGQISQLQVPEYTLCTTRSPLRVFMYDLPARFNIGMLDRRISDDDENFKPVSSQNLPPWPSDSGLKLQHSVEYWMMASLLYEGGEEWREAVRVYDPETADVFFVPFFSSLSFNVHGHNMTDPQTEVDRQLQVDMLKFVWKSKYWLRSRGRDHVIAMHHPNAFRFLREHINTSILIVADFGRYPQTMSRLSKDVVAPYVHVVDSFTDESSSDPYESRTTLLFFRGRTIRKDDGIVRAKLGSVLHGFDDVIYEQSYVTNETIKAASQGMRSSKFCLNPAGDTPSSCRLFDSIVSHCVPVIVSDKIELPFEDELDYTQFSLFFSVHEALEPGYMVRQLRQISKNRWLEMWRKLKAISHHYEFQHPPKKEDAVNMVWKQVRHKIHAAKLYENRKRRLQIPDWWTQRRRR